MSSEREDFSVKGASGENPSLVFSWVKPTVILDKEDLCVSLNDNVIGQLLGMSLGLNHPEGLHCQKFWQLKTSKAVP